MFSTTKRTCTSTAVREYVRAQQCAAASYWNPCFYDPPPHPRSGTAPSHAPCWPSLALAAGPVLSPGRAWRHRAAAGGRVALGRAVAKGDILKPPQM